jgi:hypothetical protein
MRTLLFELRPAALVDAELSYLLHQLADSIAGRSRVHIEVLVEGECDLQPEIKIALYRITQEALNNALKHAAARSVVVRLRGEEDCVTLEVTDDGRGSALLTADAKGGLGLTSIKERAAQLKGALTIDSAPQRGSCQHSPFAAAMAIFVSIKCIRHIMQIPFGEFISLGEITLFAYAALALPCCLLGMQFTLLAAQLARIRLETSDATAIIYIYEAFGSVLAGIKAKVSAATKVYYAQGCDLRGDAKEGFAEAVEIAQKADVAIVVVGGRSGLRTDCTCGEWNDRAEIGLLGVQEDLVRAIHATGKPVIVVLVDGRPLTIPWLADRQVAMLSVVIVDIWWSTPFIIMMMMAALEALPEELNDAAFEGSDSYCTAKALAKAIKPLSYSIILTGKQAVDEDNAQVYAALAEMLGISHVSIVTKLDIAADGKSAVAQREVEGGAPPHRS